MALGRQAKNVVYHEMGKGKYASAPAKGKLEAAMREVHEKVPKNVKKTGKKGKAKEKMLAAIAYSKARRS